MYKLIEPRSEDTDLIIHYKLKTIYNDTTNLSKEEQNNIKKYVNNNVPKQIINYKLIYFENHIIRMFIS